jgi:hypothetical protein
MATRHTFRFGASSRGTARDWASGSGQIIDILKVAGAELIRHPMLAASIARLGTRLRDGDIRQLTHAVRQAARRHPALFVAGGLVLGVVCARLARAVTSNDVVEGEIERRGDAVVPIEHLTTVSASERRRRTFGD